MAVVGRVFACGLGVGVGVGVGVRVLCYKRGAHDPADCRISVAGNHVVRACICSAVQRHGRDIAVAPSMVRCVCMLRWSGRRRDQPVACEAGANALLACYGICVGLREVGCLLFSSLFLDVASGVEFGGDEVDAGEE